MGVAAGVSFGLVAAIAVSVALFFWFLIHGPVVGILAATLIGITQLVYVVPLWSWARHRGFGGFAKGLVISASLVFILDSACVGFMGMASGRLPFQP